MSRCGSCTQCCRVFFECQHLVANRCECYEDRPRLCREFECMYLSDGVGDRPDKQRVVFRYLGKMCVEARETMPGAIDRVKDIIVAMLLAGLRVRRVRKP